MKFKMICSAILVMATMQAHGAVLNLAHMCKTAVTGTATCSASQTRWVTPWATALIRAESGWSQWGTIPAASKVYVCGAAADEATLTCPVPAILVAKCAVAGSTCTAPPDPTPPDVNTTGTMRLGWGAGPDWASFRLLSAAGGAELGLAKTVARADAVPCTIGGVALMCAELSGYRSGIYRFAVEGVTAGGEVSPRSAEIFRTVVIPERVGITSIAIEDL